MQASEANTRTSAEMRLQIIRAFGEGFLRWADEERLWMMHGWMNSSGRKYRPRTFSGDTTGKEVSLRMKAQICCWVSGCVLELCCKRTVEERSHSHIQFIWCRIRIETKQIFFSLSLQTSNYYHGENTFLLPVHMLLQWNYLFTDVV